MRRATPQSGILYIVLRNVGLGPALRVYVSATYDGHTDWQPAVAEQVVPIIMAGDECQMQLTANFPDEPHSDPEGVRGDCFHVAGTYLDRSRSRRNPSEIITSWPDEV